MFLSNMYNVEELLNRESMYTMFAMKKEEGKNTFLVFIFW